MSTSIETVSQPSADELSGLESTRVYNVILVPESQIELCGKELDDIDDIKTYINDAPDQGEHLRIAAERGTIHESRDT